MDIINEFLNRNREKKLNIHCLGDAMVDEYIDVQVNRISPEWPAMVLHSDSPDGIREPGGAANVVYQFKHFNINALLFCWYDWSAIEVFRSHGIDSSMPLASARCDLPVKKRFLAGSVQVARHDSEKHFCGLNEETVDKSTLQLVDIIKNSIKPDVVILSDYDKGFFSSTKHRILDNYKDVITIVDPKNGPLSKWKGCTIFKPNAKEAAELTGLTDWKEQAEYLQKELECESVVITFGGEKVAGICKNEFFIFEPKKDVKVASVVGAGDCFAAFFAMAIGHKFSVFEATEIAWNAGAIYVENKRNRPVVPAELTNGIVNPLDLVHRDFDLVMTNGCFDFGLTAAHVKCLEFAKQQGDKLVVALNEDESVRRLKGDNRPILPFQERAEIILALESVDFVVGFTEDTPIDLIKIIKPSLIVKGGDYKIEEVVGNDIAEVRLFPLVDVTSTTEKIKKFYKL